MDGVLTQAKQDLRGRMRARLAEVSAGEAAGWSAGVVARMLASGPCRGTRCAMLFLSVPGEPDLTELGRVLSARGVRVCLPRVDWANGTMTAALIRDPDRDTVLSRHGVREPNAACPAVDRVELDFVAVPGLAFDGSGRRLGRGGGFYDRFLTGLGAFTVGVGFEVQFLPFVPAGAGDVPVRAIVTERRWVVVGESRDTAGPADA
jgi:5-formyltetrahydrofolate cyclo-ligase